MDLRHSFDKTPNWAFLVFFAAITLVLYFNALGYPFLFDDIYLIPDNQFVKSFSLGKIFSSDVFYFNSKAGYDFNDSYYRPLQLLSYAFEYRIWNLNPVGYRLDNILLHAANAFLLFWVIFSIFKNKLLAFLSAVFFCIHPAQVCLVTFISGRSNLLETFLTLSSLAVFIRWLSAKKAAYYLFSLSLFIAALLTREGAVLLIFYQAVSLFCLKEKRKAFFSLLPYCFIAFIYFSLRKIFMPCGRLSFGNLLGWRSLFDFLFYSQSYFWQLIFPLNIKEAVFSYPASKAFFYLVSSVMFIIISLWAAIKRNRTVIFALFLFFAGLLPVVGLGGLIRYMGPVLSEHYAYNASLGFCLLLAYSCLVFFKNLDLILKVVIAAICSYFLILTVSVNRYYKSEVSFYRYALSMGESNKIARLNLGNAYYKEGDFDSALREAKVLIESNPRIWDFYLLAGNAYKEKGELSLAYDQYQKALALNPHSYLLYNNLGNIYKLQGKYDQALEAYERSYSASKNPVVLANIIRLLIDRREFDKAWAACEEALENSGDKAGELVNIGIYWAQAGYSQQAEILFKEALRIDPQSYQAMQNLAFLFGNKNDFDQAIFYVKSALKVKPDDRYLKAVSERLTSLKKRKIK